MYDFNEYASQAEKATALDLQEQEENLNAAADFHKRRAGKVTASIADRCISETEGMSEKQFTLMCDLWAAWRLEDCGALDAWAQRQAGTKTGAAAQLGLDSEKRIADLLREKINAPAFKLSGITMGHPEIPDLGATPDAFAGDVYAQFKTAVKPGNFDKFRFVKRIEDLCVVSANYYYQSLCEMAVTGAETYIFTYYCPYSDTIDARTFERKEALSQIRIFEAKAAAFLVTARDCRDCRDYDTVAATLAENLNGAAKELAPIAAGTEIAVNGEPYLVRSVYFDYCKASKQNKNGSWSKAETKVCYAEI